MPTTSENSSQIDIIRRSYLFLLLFTVVATFSVGSYVYSSSLQPLHNIYSNRRTTLQLLQVMRHYLNETLVGLRGNGIGLEERSSDYLHIAPTIERCLNNWKKQQFSQAVPTVFSSEMEELISKFLIVSQQSQRRINPDTLSAKINELRNSQIQFKDLRFEQLRLLALIRATKQIEFNTSNSTWILTEKFADVERQLLYLFCETKLSRRDTSVSFSLLEKGLGTRELDTVISRFSSEIKNEKGLYDAKLASVPIPMFGISTSARTVLVLHIIFTFCVYFYLHSWLTNISKMLLNQRFQLHELAWQGFFVWHGSFFQRVFSWVYILIPGIVAMTSVLLLTFVGDVQSPSYGGGNNVTIAFHGASRIIFFDNEFHFALLPFLLLSMVLTLIALYRISKKTSNIPIRPTPRKRQQKGKS